MYEWIANKRMNAVGLKVIMLTTSKWIAGGEVQVAPKKQKYPVILLVVLNKMLKRYICRIYTLNTIVNEVLSINKIIFLGTK